MAKTREAAGALWRRGLPSDERKLRKGRICPAVAFQGYAVDVTIVDDPGEYARLWALALRVFPPFEQYREWAGATGRTIPIVVLAPA